MNSCGLSVRVDDGGKGEICSYCDDPVTEADDRNVHHDRESPSITDTAAKDCNPPTDPRAPHHTQAPPHIKFDITGGGGGRRRGPRIPAATGPHAKFPLISIQVSWPIRPRQGPPTTSAEEGNRNHADASMMVFALSYAILCYVLLLKPKTRRKNPPTCHHLRTPSFIRFGKSVFGFLRCCSASDSSLWLQHHFIGSEFMNPSKEKLKNAEEIFSASLQRPELCWRMKGDDKELGVLKMTAKLAARF
ncbi:hypothetical protein NL676_033207 [Syzygium grande]|nr:hypothetical protein NL676_033207 [Syzygium grande]